MAEEHTAITKEQLFSALSSIDFTKLDDACDLMHKHFSDDVIKALDDRNKITFILFARTLHDLRNVILDELNEGLVQL